MDRGGRGAGVGFDAALAFGVDLGRCIVVPEPGEHWLSVTAGLVEVTSLVLVRPPVAVSEQQAARMLARLRQKDAAFWSTQASSGIEPGRDRSAG